MAHDAFALMLAMLALGMAFARTALFPVNAADVLNRVVLNVCLPAAVLLYLPKLQLQAGLLGLALTPWLLMLATWGLAWLAARAWSFDRGRFAVLLLCVGLCNSSFLGFPMVRALLGEHALQYAVVFDQFGTFLLLSTVGLYVCARYSGDAPPGARQMLARILAFPPVWALLAALTVMPAQPPEWIASGLRRLAEAMLPLVMLAVGLSIQLRLPREDVRPLLTGLALKLVVLPCIALGLSLLFGMDGLMLRTNVLESAMPSMISAAALAMAHGLAPRLAAALVGYGILLCLATLPAWVWWLERLQL
jgi:predicted permease